MSNNYCILNNKILFYFDTKLLREKKMVLGFGNLIGILKKILKISHVFSFQCYSQQSYSHMCIKV